MTDLWTQVSDVLTAVRGELERPPDRVYVANGTPAFDQCDQLTAHVAGFRRGTPSTERPDHPAAPTTVVVVITRTWCIPTGDGENPPTVKEHFTSGQEVVNGADELWRATMRATKQVSCRPRLEGGDPVGPSGGTVGWAVTVSWVP
jgi:hypothetical protein